MRKPDFFIVGVPKSGTTALKSYLAQHPDIFIPKNINEFNFLGEQSSKSISSMEEYYSYFGEAGNEKRVGEKSVWYFYSARSRDAIKQIQPEADIIIMLRNPVEMIYSLHNQLLYTCEEDVTDFRVALNLENLRRMGKNIPYGAHVPWHLFYCENGKYSNHVKEWIKLFGQEHVHIIIYDDFRNETSAVYKKVLEFLGVNNNFKPKFDLINSNKAIKNYKLHHFIQNTAIRTLWKKLLPLKIRKKIGLGERLRIMNTKNVSRPPMPDDIKVNLQKEFYEDIINLGIVLNRDLSHWVN